MPGSGADEIENLLASAPPFSALPAAERRPLAAGLRLTRFASGETVFSEGQGAAEAWLVLSGGVRILAYYEDDRLMQLERLGRGQLFGLFCRMADRGRTYQCTAVADGALAAVRIPDGVWQQCLERSPAFARRACTLCAARLAHMRRCVVLDREGADQRVARALMRLSRAQGPEVAATRHYLAIETGTALETVFRVLARLRRRGWIVTGRRTIRICDPAALAALAERGRPPRKSL